MSVAKFTVLARIRLLALITLVLGHVEIAWSMRRGSWSIISGPGSVASLSLPSGPGSHCSGGPFVVQRQNS